MLWLLLLNHAKICRINTIVLKDTTMIVSQNIAITHWVASGYQHSLVEVGHE